jgi:hypothetical protein
MFDSLSPYLQLVPTSKVTVVQETALEDAGFVLSHVVSWCSRQTPGIPVVFLALQNTYLHYATIQKKLGSPLSSNLQFFDVLSTMGVAGSVDRQSTVKPPFARKVSPPEHYQQVTREHAVEMLCSGAWDDAFVIVDDLNALCDDDASVVQRVLHARRKASVTLGFVGVCFRESETSFLLSQSCLSADTVVQIWPMSTGYVKDVHGKATFVRRDGPSMDLLYRRQDLTVRFFHPGSHV